MRTLQKLSIAVLATAISATALTAQARVAPPVRPNRNAMQPPNRDAQPPQAQGQGRGQRQAGFRSGPAANMLRMREQLDLSDEQVKQLEGINARRAGQVDRAEMMRARADLMEAQRGDINLDKAKAAYDRMSRLKTDQQLSQLKVRQDARKVLTAEQRGKVDQFSQRMQGRRGMAMRARGNARAGAQGGVRAPRNGPPRLGPPQGGPPQGGPPQAGAPRPGGANGNRMMRQPPPDSIR